MGVFQNNLLAGAAAAATSGASGFYDHQIEQSARFDRVSSSNLSRTFSAGDRRTFTYAFWFKITAETDSSWPHAFVVGSTNNNQISHFQGGLYIQVQGNGLLTSSSGGPLFRDSGGWTHWVVAFDLDNGTNTNKIKFYHNGNLITDFSSDSRSSMGADSDFNTGTNYIGKSPQSGNMDLGAYLAEFVFIDGQQLEPSSFTETKNGVLIPKDVSGLTFGSNGFYLKFENASDLGNDSSGNNNDFTSNNLGADHQVLDSPTFGS